MYATLEGMAAPELHRSTGNLILIKQPGGEGVLAPSRGRAVAQRRFPRWRHCMAKREAESVVELRVADTKGTCAH